MLDLTGCGGSYLYKLLDSCLLSILPLSMLNVLVLVEENSFGLVWLVVNRFWFMVKIMPAYSSSWVQVSPCKEYTNDRRLSLLPFHWKKRRGVNHILWFQGYLRSSFCRLANLEYKPPFSIRSMCLPSCKTIQRNLDVRNQMMVKAYTILYKLVPTIMRSCISKRSQQH